MSVANDKQDGNRKSLSEWAKDLEEIARTGAEAGASLDSVERQVKSHLLQMGKVTVDLFIRLQGNGDLGQAIETEDPRTLYRSDEPVPRKLRSIFGVHSFESYVYSAGAKQAIELRPLDARMQLPAHEETYLFEEFSQFFCIEQAFGKSQDAIARVLDQKISVDTLEHINRRLGERAGSYLAELPVPEPTEEGELLVETFDGKGVPMVHEDAEKLRAFETEKILRPGNRRMATLACVYSVDRHVTTPEKIVEALFRDGTSRQRSDRPKPLFKHVVAFFPKTHDLEGEMLTTTGPLEACCWAEREVSKRRRAEQPLLRLIDGQQSLWETAALRHDQDVIEILDLLHVSQYVWKAAKSFFTARSDQETFARDRLLRILRGQVRSVITGMRRMSTITELTAAARKEIATVCNYFERHQSRMNYDEYLLAGYPIATGVIESACKHLVKDRMERSGMRWTLDGAQAMLNVRAIYQSSYWDDFHQQRIQQEQASIHPLRNLILNYAVPLAA